MRRQDNICRVRLFFAAALTAAVMIGAGGVRRAGDRKMAGHEIEMGEKETKEGLPAESEKVMKDETEEVLEQEGAKRADTKTEGQDRGEQGGAAEAAAGADRAQASGHGTMSEPDMIFQGELKPQSAMEAGRGMQWKLDWEFAGEGEWTWTE